MAAVEIEIDDLTEQQAKNRLSAIIQWLDELDNEDYFGTEGWKRAYESQL